MFNGIWLVAVEPLTVQGRTVQAGERFHISRVHAGALLVTGRATIAEPQPPPKVHVESAPPMPTRRRGRPRKTPVAEPPPDVTPEPVVPEPVAPEPPAAPEPQGSPDVAAPSDSQTRSYLRRDLEAEP
jgi:hypothetical protein